MNQQLEELFWNKIVISKTVFQLNLNILNTYYDFFKTRATYVEQIYSKQIPHFTSSI